METKPTKRMLGVGRTLAMLSLAGLLNKSALANPYSLERFDVAQKKDKLRLDQLLVLRGLAPSRTRAQALIMAGKVIVGENRVDKPGTRLPTDSPIRVKGPDHPYVSRGGVKLQGALDQFGFSVKGLVVLDVGASTGGFTDCVLQRGAERVIALDVGRAQLHQKLRDDPRVEVIERYNARHLRPADLSKTVDLAVCDLSFISLKLVLGQIAACVCQGGHIVPLVKPQFELEKGLVGKGGIVREEQHRHQAVEQVIAYATSLGLTLVDQCRSGLPGADGNIEFLLLLRK